MALDSDGLLDQLLFKIALSGDQGVDIQGLSDSVALFHSRIPVEQEEEDEHHEAESDILFSLKPPGSASSRNSQAFDPQHIEKLWTWLVEHPDIELRKDSRKPADDAPTTADQDNSQDAHEIATVLRAHADERLYANENRIWHALADHGVDFRRIPKLEFQCLSVIAAAGPEGLLQPELTRLTGQDKRSVPKRTDSLATKGLITKELCVGLGLKTSILRFKKFIQQGDNHAVFDVGKSAGERGDVANSRMIRYDEWFAEIVGHLKKHNNIMAVDDLRKEMGIDGKKWETRALHRCMRRLFKTGMCVRLKARASPVEVPGPPHDREDLSTEVDAEPDAEGEDVIDHQMTGQEVKMRERRVVRGSKVRWIRCIKMMRDPDERDKAAFTSNAAAERGMDDDSEAEPEDEELEELRADDDALEAIADRNETQRKRRIPPQWRPGIPHTQFIFGLVNNSGTNGISTMDLTDRAMGHNWRRPLDELLGRLTDVWRVSQPPHLRHLSVIRDTAFLNKSSHYQFRSFGNFKKLVESGQVTWEAIGIKSNEIENEAPDLDRWGFPAVRPSFMLGPDGIANPATCKASVIKPHHRRAWDPLRTKRVNGSKQTLGTPKVKREATTATIATPTPQQEHVDMGPPAATQPRTMQQQRIMFTPAMSVRSEDTPERLKGSASKKTLFKMNPKRVEAELKAWQARSKRLANSLARAEVVMPPLQVAAKPTDGENPRPSKKLRTSTATDEDGPQREPQTISEERVAEIEAEISSMSRPGIYINPPGSGQKKMFITQPTGRPSKYLIAVFKSPLLHDKDWFTGDEWTLPESSKDETSAREPSLRPGDMSNGTIDPETQSIAQSTDLNEHVAETHEGSPQAPNTTGGKVRRKSDFTITGGRKRRNRTSLREHVAKKQATIDYFGLPTFTPVNRQSQADIAQGTPKEQSSPVGRATQDPSSAVPEGGVATELAPAPSAATSLESIEHTRPGVTRAELPDTIMTDVPSGPARDMSPQMVDSAPSVTNAGTEVDPEATTVENSSTKEQDSSIEMPIVVEEIDGPPPPAASDEPASKLKDIDGKDASHTNVLSVQQVKEEAEVSTTVRYKVGVPRSGGITKHQRETLVLAILREHGGMFAGDKELHLPFITEWEKTHTQRPDRNTLERVLKSLMLEGKINKIAFTFKAQNDRIITKHIVMEPEIDPESEAVKQLQQKMISSHPNLYIPPGVKLAPDLQARFQSHRAADAIGRRSYQMTSRDHFVEDNTAFISRLHPVARPVTVKLGMTEAKLQRDLTNRRRKREQEERRQERYLKAMQEEDIEAAASALQTDFQLDVYEHEPNMARVDRGPRGRARLQKLQRWGAPSLTAHKKALGLLGASKKQQSTEHFGGNSAMRHRDYRRSLAATGEEGYEQYMAAAGPRFVPRVGSLALQSGSGSKIVEMFTLTTPYQRFYPASGTFSTDQLVVSAADNSTWGSSSGQEQLPMTLADVFIQANSNTYGAVDMARASDEFWASEERPSMFADSLGSLMSDETAQVRQKMASYYRNTGLRILGPGKTPAKSRLSRPLQPNRNPSKKEIVPRASRTGIFSMTKAEEQRLLIAFIVTRTLAGGLEQIPNWGIIHQIFHYKFDANYCRNRWASIKGKQAATADKLQTRFQELFIEAYEKGELPEIDFLEPENYDWVALVEWAEARLDPGQFEFTSNELPELPRTRRLLDNEFEVEVPENVYGINKEDYWQQNVTLLRRDELARDWTHSAVLEGSKTKNQRRGEKDDPLMLAKSWVRANVLTPDTEFNSIAAHDKLVQLGEEKLPRALEDLLGAKIIRMENKGRTIPGRNYDISDTVLATFKRTWDSNHLRQAAAYKKTLDKAFSEHGRLEIAYNTPDHATLAMTNLVACGMCRVMPHLPPVNNAHDAPWPRLTKWGFTDGNYKTVQLDKERLHFGLFAEPTDKYVYGTPIPVSSAVNPPPLTCQVPGEIGARLPLWTDINGRLIGSVWDMMRMATLHILAFRPACTVQVIKGIYKDKLWAWEIELFLEWAEKAGVARRVRIGEDDGDDAEDGWTTAEWWWLAFSED